MQKLRSIIVENDPKSLSLLLSLIADYCPEIEIVATTKTIKNATMQIVNQQPDLVFLDLELDDGLGFDVLYQLPYSKFKTIVISGFYQYALDAFKFGVIHYLLKPVSIKDLRIAIDRVLHPDTIDGIHKQEKKLTGNNTSSPKKIQISTNNGIEIINLHDIEYFKADGSYTIIHFKNKTSLIASKHLKSFESILTESNFYRVGRSHIINLDCIKVYNKHSGGKITMVSGSSVIVPRRNKNDFMEYLNSYLVAF
jgi:two-component system LytT family response regulator